VQRVVPIIPKELSGDKAQGTTTTWSTQLNRHTKMSVHSPLADYIGYAASHEARLGYTYGKLPTDPPQQLEKWQYRDQMTQTNPPNRGRTLITLILKNPL
jgi:hypothetical protein